MHERGCNVGGEQSGHIVLSDYCTTGDGLIAALQILAVIRNSGRKASEVCSVFAPVPQLLQNVKAPGSILETPTVKDIIAKAEAKLGAGGRFVIRKSGTEPLVRVMAEGDDANLIKQLVGEICLTIEKAAS
jgi:phosphoglucosamine mutase